MALSSNQAQLTTIFAKENKKKLVNIHIKKEHAKFIRLRNIFTSEVQ